LKSSLSGAKVRHKKTDVGIDNTNQSDPRNIQTFGNHLSANKNLRIAKGKALQNPFMTEATTCGIGIHAQDCCCGKAFF
jgi:hypothetical protein